MVSASVGNSHGPSVPTKSLMAGLNVTRKPCKHSRGRSFGDRELRSLNTVLASIDSDMSSDFTTGVQSIHLSFCCGFRLGE